MRFSKNTCIIGRKDNVLVVDFTPRSEPPAPRFPGEMLCDGILLKKSSYG